MGNTGHKNRGLVSSLSPSSQWIDEGVLDFDRTDKMRTEVEEDLSFSSSDDRLSFQGGELFEQSRKAAPSIEQIGFEQALAGSGLPSLHSPYTGNDDSPVPSHSSSSSSGMRERPLLSPSSGLATPRINRRKKSAKKPHSPSTPFSKGERRKKDRSPTNNHFSGDFSKKSGSQESSAPSSKGVKKTRSGEFLDDIPRKGLTVSDFSSPASRRLRSEFPGDRGKRNATISEATSVPSSPTTHTSAASSGNSSNSNSSSNNPSR